MRTVIEFHEFMRKAENVFGADEREKIVEYLSNNPTAGMKLENFGGIRRLERRTNTEYNIYYHPGAKSLQLVIIAIFRKNEKMVLDKLIEILIHHQFYFGITDS